MADGPAGLSRAGPSGTVDGAGRTRRTTTASRWWALGGVFFQRAVLAASMSGLLRSSQRAKLWRLAGCVIGEGTAISAGARVISPAGVKMGVDVFINCGCTLDGAGGLVIEDKVSVARNVLIGTTSHEVGPWYGRAGRHKYAPVLVGQGSWIGDGVIVLPGVTIGRGAIVGAGSVVTRDVPPNTVVAGSPARALRSLD
jgi:acetyltransferase-like isoleucine patch superfamily enzyme